MSSSHSHNQNVAEIRNTSRFCIENPQISWVLLIGTLIWGIYGFTHMPQRKDPDVPVKQAMVVTRWPGASAEKVEELVTRTVEKKPLPPTRTLPALIPLRAVTSRPLLFNWLAI